METKKKEVVVETEDPMYAVYTDSWGPTFTGLDDSIGSDASFAGTFGVPITNFTVGAKGIKKFRIRTKKKGKWQPYRTGFDISNTSDGTAITGIEIVGTGFAYAVHIKGGTWLPTTRTSDVEGEVIVGSGTPIDAIWIERV